MLILFRLSSWLPLLVLHALGWALGWLAFLASPGYRREFLKNARLGGNSRSDCRRAVGAAGQLVAELPRLWMGRLPSIHWRGVEALDVLVASGQGVLLLTPHLGSFEATAQAYAARYASSGKPMTVLYRAPRKVWLQALVAAARRRPGLDAATTTLAGVRQLLRALQRGHCVGLLPDQVPPLQLGVWAPFFGVPAYTMTLSARLAAQTGAAVVMAWGERLPWGRGYVVHIERLPQDLPADPLAAASAINAAMEQLILRRPDQYLWGYARYKTPRDTI